MLAGSVRFKRNAILLHLNFILNETFSCNIAVLTKRLERKITTLHFYITLELIFSIFLSHQGMNCDVNYNIIPDM